MDLNTILELKGAGVDIEGALRRFSGNSVLYEKFLKKFLTDSTFSQITKAFEGENREDALMATHTLKELRPIWVWIGCLTYPLLWWTISGRTALMKLPERIRSWKRLTGRYAEYLQMTSGNMCLTAAERK